MKICLPSNIGLLTDSNLNAATPVMNRSHSGSVNPRSAVLPGRRKVRAFTLLEVMVAVAIFFVAIFAILELVSQNLKYVQNLQKPRVDPGVLASELSLTNALEEGVESGDFGDLYPDATWSRETILVGSNGLFRVDITVFEHHDGAAAESKLSIVLYRPDSGDPGGAATLPRR